MERAVAVLTDVKDLAELLNGSSVDQARIGTSGGRLTLDMELTRAMPEQQRVVRYGLFKRIKTPWVKSRLTLNQITEVAIQRLADQPPNPVPLFSCEAVPGGYELIVTAPDGLRLQCKLEQLSGTFIDVGSPIDSP